MDVERIRDINEDLCEAAWVSVDSHEGLIHYALELSGEVGELNELIKKVNRRRFLSKKKGKKFKKRKWIAIEKEIADVYLALDRIAAHFGIDLEEVVQEKLNEQLHKNGFKTINFYKQ